MRSERGTVRRVVAGLALAAIAAAGCTERAGAPDDPCARLSGDTTFDFAIVTARHVDAGDRGPAHCEVIGRIDTEINFELLLPDEWNGRFMMGGGGGYVGSVQN